MGLVVSTAQDGNCRQDDGDTFLHDAKVVKNVGSSILLPMKVMPDSPKENRLISPWNAWKASLVPQLSHGTDY